MRLFFGLAIASGLLFSVSATVMLAGQIGIVKGTDACFCRAAVLVVAFACSSCNPLIYFPVAIGKCMLCGRGGVCSGGFPIVTGVFRSHAFSV